MQTVNKPRPKPEKDLIPAQKQKTSIKKINGAAHNAIGNSTINEFSELKNISGYSNDTLASLIGITHRTIRNKHFSSNLFNIAQTERLRKLAGLFEEGNVVFSNKQEFNKWLEQPSYALDYKTPYQLLQQPGGLDKVMQELRAIKFGDAI